MSITYCLYSLAQALADDAPDRARALLDEALQLNVALGYDSYELIGMTLVAVRLGDWRLTANLAGRTIRYLHWVNERPMLGGIMNVSARAIADTDPEAAAAVQGAARTLALGITTPDRADNASGNTDSRAGLISDVRRETTGRIRDTLGDDRLRELRDQGAALDRDDAVAYTLSHLDAFLIDPGH